MANGKKNKAKGGFKTILFFMIFSLAAILFLRMTFVLLIVGILPTIVVHFIDTSKTRDLFHTVFACNMAGVLPYVADIFANGNDKSSMIQALSSMEVLFVMYLSAGFGWALMFAGPHVARFIITSINENNVRHLRNKQEHLAKEWGDEIAQPPYE